MHTGPPKLPQRVRREKEREKERKRERVGQYRAMRRIGEGGGPGIKGAGR